MLLCTTAAAAGLTLCFCLQHPVSPASRGVPAQPLELPPELPASSPEYLRQGYRRWGTALRATRSAKGSADFLDEHLRLLGTCERALANDSHEAASHCLSIMGEASDRFLKRCQQGTPEAVAALQAALMQQNASFDRQAVLDAHWTAAVSICSHC